MRARILSPHPTSKRPTRPAVTAPIMVKTMMRTNSPKPGILKSKYVLGLYFGGNMDPTLESINAINNQAIYNVKAAGAVTKSPAKK